MSSGRESSRLSGRALTFVFAVSAIIVAAGCGEDRERCTSGLYSAGSPPADSTRSRCEGSVAISCEPDPDDGPRVDDTWFIRRTDCGARGCLLQAHQVTISGDTLHQYITAMCAD